MVEQTEEFAISDFLFSLDGVESTEATFQQIRENMFSSSNAFMDMQALLYEMDEETFKGHFKSKHEGTLVYGYLCFLNNQLERSEELFRGIKSYLPWAAYWLVKVYVQLRNWDLALATAEAAKEKFPDKAALDWLLLEVWILTGWEKEAADKMKAMEKQFADDVRLDLLKGQLEEYQGNYGAAVFHYEQALEKDEYNSQALFRLGFLNGLHGDEDEAMAYYKRCAELKPVHINALINLGIMYEDRQQYVAASTCFKSILKYYPSHPRAKMYIKDAEASTSMCYDKDREKEITRQNRILKIPVTDFELSVRSRNCLNKMNIETLGDLIMKTEAELIAYKNFGDRSLQEVKNILKQKGLRLGQGLEQKPVEEPEEVSDEIEQGIDPELLNRPIEFLNLSIRSRRCMERLNIRTIRDLIYKSEVELISAKNFGVTSLNEVKQKLTEMNLSLRE